MTYYNNAIPQASDFRQISQQQIKSNFQAINTVWANNHAALTDANQTFQGMHDVLTMRSQMSDPATAAGQVALYNKLVSSIPELFFRPQSNATPIQLTYPSLSTNPQNLTQYTFAAGPFVIYGGLIKNASKGKVVTLSPSSTLLYVGLTTANFNGVSTATKSTIPTNITGSAFTITCQTFAVGTTFDVYYIAIGK